MRVGDRVEVVGIGFGWVAAIKQDERGEGLYSILLEDSNLTPDGYFLARSGELRYGV